MRVLQPDDVKEIYELRILLETHALRSAMEQISPPEVDELEGIVDELIGSVKARSG